MPELSNVSVDGFMLDGHEEKQECNVLVLYVGGTIGMVKNEEGVYIPSPNTMVRKLRGDSRMHDENYFIKKFGADANVNSLILPEVSHLRRVIYTIHEYDPLIDSSNITSSHWNKIANDILNNYELYDGFVVLHGTDTLSYTASALSFMLEHLGKTVVLTGSQIPIYQTRTDGADNFIGSLILAGNLTIPEVTVFFHNKLMRGNRTIKFSSNSLDAFTSPNSPELAILGTEIIVNYNEIFCSQTIERCTVQTSLNENVGLLRIFPNISLQLVKSFLHSEIEGIVLETYGAGNFISNRKDLIMELKNAVKRGIIIVNCTQCYSGKVSYSYASGQILYTIGVLCGFDMTSEAALSKLSYVLTKKDWSLEKKKEMMNTNLRGEMTNEIKDRDRTNSDFLDVLGKSLGLSCKREFMELGNVIFPAMVNTAVLKMDAATLNSLKSYGANLNQPNYDHRTPLHIACCEGNTQMIEFLLRNGCMLHVKDRNGRTPLVEAVLHDHHESISLLRKAGAHLAGNLKCVGEDLCSAASRGLIERLKSYSLAGVDMNQSDKTGRTALHAAVICNQPEVIMFLQSCGVSPKLADKFGHTALDNAMALRHTNIINLLLNFST